MEKATCLSRHLTTTTRASAGAPRAFYVPPATLPPRRATTARKANRSPFDAFCGSKRWKMSRRAQLTEHPLCQFRLENGSECGAIADSVHHIVELTEGGAPRTRPTSCRRAARTTR